MDEGGYETADSEYSSPASSEPDAEFQGAASGACTAHRSPPLLSPLLSACFMT